MLRVNRHLPQRVSFLSLSIDHMLHLPLAHRMKKKMRVYLQGLVMISYIRLTHWCNDFAKIPHKAEDMHAGMDCHQAALSKGWSLGAGEEYENRDLCYFV